MKVHEITKMMGVGVLALSLFTGCSDDDDDEIVFIPEELPPLAVPTFAAEGALSARIRRTDYGVPHIQGDNLESIGFGAGYAYAEDNICLLADQIVRFNSQRARYFGPGSDPAQNNAENLINDFSYLALGIRDHAEQGFGDMSENSRAILSGYVKGYNKYLTDTGNANLDPRCAGQDWVYPLSEVDLITYSLGIALLPGAGQFIAPIFLAAPPGVDPSPVMASNDQNKDKNQQQNQLIAKLDVRNLQVAMPERNPMELGSNGWGLGGEMTENGRGIVLGNPHFPHTGNLRFWQFHTTIPGVLNVAGGSLTGMPGVVNIGFNENIGWTHTFSTAEHFIAYQLAITPDDPSGMTYIDDGVAKQITGKTLSVDVLVQPGVAIPFSKTVYYSDFGPMVVVPGNLEWSASGAYTIKDANAKNFDIIDHWLGMNLARNMTEFQQAFKDYDGVIFNNTMAADKNGNAFYIDDSTVPNLSTFGLFVRGENADALAAREQAGFTILPGSSLLDFDGAVPYEKAPKLLNRSFVQNSNDSFWLTNPATPITGVSPLFGEVNNEQSWRSRLGQKLLTDPAGNNGKFSMAEVESALLGNRSYLSEALLADLMAHCQARGDNPVLVGEQSVDISAGCTALGIWDGTMNLNSQAAHLFREFAQQFNSDPQWAVPFSAEDPANTPNTMLANDRTLEHFAQAMLNVAAAGLSLDATLGSVQFVEKSNLDGTATGVKLPWGGANNIEGGFNVFRANLGNDGTLLPRHTYPPISGSQLSAEGAGYHITYGSSWMYLVGFTNDGPVAKGLMTFSQSTDPTSPYYQDQTELYSAQPQLRDIRFTEADIEANKVSDITISY